MKSEPPTSPSASASTSAPPPSYSETLSSPTQNRLPLNPPTYATSLRAPRINALVNDHIIPHLHQSAMDGIMSSTLILIPSNVSDLMHVDMSNSDPKQEPLLSSFAFPGEKVVGFPDKDAITVSRLNGPENKLEFWRQAGVLRELLAQLRRTLESQGYSVVDHARPMPQRNGPTSPSLDVRSAEWKAVEQPMLADGEARIATDFKEITLRLENEMSLYETRSGMALVVKTEIGGVREEDDY